MKVIFDEIYISELGHIMVKVYNIELKVWTTYNFGNVKDKIKELYIPKNKIKGR